MTKFKKMYESRKEIHHSELEQDARAILEKFFGIGAARRLKVPSEIVVRFQSTLVDLVHMRI